MIESSHDSVGFIENVIEGRQEVQFAKSPSGDRIRHRNAGLLKDRHHRIRQGRPLCPPIVVHLVHGFPKDHGTGSRKGI